MGFNFLRWHPVGGIDRNDFAAKPAQVIIQTGRATSTIKYALFNILLRQLEHLKYSQKGRPQR